MDEYNAGKSGGNVHIVSQAAADQLMAVVVIREKGVSSRYYGTKFDGLMEVVYDNAADSKYVIDERSLTGGAVMRAKQTVVIPEASLQRRQAARYSRSGTRTRIYRGQGCPLYLLLRGWLAVDRRRLHERCRRWS